VRTKTDSSGKKQWLMLHKHDDCAVDGWSAEDQPRSVLSGRTNDEVKADPDRLWRSDLPGSRAAVLLKADRIGVANEDELVALDALGSSGSCQGRPLGPPPGCSVSRRFADARWSQSTSSNALSVTPF
jgi:bifunctional non-homologous end joining protein LigD